MKYEVNVLHMFYACMPANVYDVHYVICTIILVEC